MKTMNPIILFLFIAFLFPGKLHALCSLNLKECRELSASEAEAVLETQFFNITNSRFNLSGTDNYLVVLKNNRSCEDCFADINGFIKAAKKLLKAKIVCVSLVDSTTLERKRAIARSMKLMPELDSNFVIYKNGDSKNFFTGIHTDHTPELLIIRQGKIIHVPYNMVFQGNSGSVNFDTQQIIFQMLK